MAGSDWFVVRTRPLQDGMAARNIERQGAECYIPRAMLRSQRTRRLAARPLFPGYAFVRHPDDQWNFLRGTFGVLEVMMVGGERPARLSAAEIEKMRAREGPDGLVRLEAREFRRGERVRVESGSLSLDAVVDGMAARDRIFVLLGILGRQTRTEVEVRDVSRGD